MIYLSSHLVSYHAMPCHLSCKVHGHFKTSKLVIDGFVVCYWMLSFNSMQCFKKRVLRHKWRYFNCLNYGHLNWIEWRHLIFIIVSSQRMNAHFKHELRVIVNWDMYLLLWKNKVVAILTQYFLFQNYIDSAINYVRDLM